MPDIPKTRCRCAICKTCWFDPMTGHCIYGGPYSGFVKVEENGGGKNARDGAAHKASENITKPEV
jgi:hypothetical protein